MDKFVDKFLEEPHYHRIGRGQAAGQHNREDVNDRQDASD